MKHGFVKVAAVTPDIRVADVAYNTGTDHVKRSKEAAENMERKLLCFRNSV